jgi:hypothetical protein
MKDVAESSDFTIEDLKKMRKRDYLWYLHNLKEPIINGLTQGTTSDLIFGGSLPVQQASFGFGRQQQQQQ